MVLASWIVLAATASAISAAEEKKEATPYQLGEIVVTSDLAG